MNKNFKILLIFLTASSLQTLLKASGENNTPLMMFGEHEKKSWQEHERSAPKSSNEESNQTANSLQRAQGPITMTDSGHGDQNQKNNMDSSSINPSMGLVTTATTVDPNNRPRSSSAPAQLGENRFTVLGKKEPLVTDVPTPVQVSQAEEAYSQYHEALVERKNASDSCVSAFLGLTVNKKVKEARTSLEKVYNEGFYLNQALKESKNLYLNRLRKEIARAGGNPYIGEEVFHESFGVPDATIPLIQIKNAQKQKSESGDTFSDTSSSSSSGFLGSNGGLQSRLNSPKNIRDNVEWRSVSSRNPTPFDDFFNNQDSDNDSVYSDFARKNSDNIPFSFLKFEESITHLSREKIAAFFQSLSDDQIQELAPLRLEDQEIAHCLSPDDLREQLTDLYANLSQEAQKRISFENPETENAIMDSFLEQPASIERQGLHNSGVDCYLNSGLQCLRDHVANLPPGDKDLLLESIQHRYQENLTPAQRNFYRAAFGSPLAAFLEYKFDGSNHLAASFLRKEIQGIMEQLATSGQRSSAAAREIAESIDPETGRSLQQCDMSEFLTAIMEYTGTSRTLLEEKDTYLTGPLANQLRLVENQQGRQQGGELIIPFGVEQPATIQKVIESNLVADLSNIKDIDLSQHDIHRERRLLNPPDSISISLARFRMMPDKNGGWAKNSKGEDIVGVSNLAIDAYGQAIPEKLQTRISGLLDKVIFPTSNEDGIETQTTYDPTLMSCHYGGQSANSGHYATYLKKGNQWYLFNDARVTAVRLDDLMPPYRTQTYRAFLERNAYVINYRKVTE